tara:strand:+ start:460 stop:735 length:276 start_codon:yes stop_codon:yes gene_type:complete
MSKYSHAPGGPYYFKTGLTYHGYLPSREVTKEEADELAKQDYAYYVAYFDSSGKPNRVLKYHRGKKQLDREIKYDADGNQILGIDRIEDIE